MNNKDGRLALNIDALKEHRKQRGLSQEKVAEECLKQGLLVSVSSIKRAELGMNVLYRTATQLATFYNVGIETLLPCIDSPPSTHTYCDDCDHKNLLTIVIEMKNPLQKAQIDDMLDGSQKRSHQQENYLTVDWFIDDGDERVYEKVQRICTRLKSAFESDIRLFIESTTLAQSPDIRSLPSFVPNKKLEHVFTHNA